MKIFLILCISLACKVSFGQKTQPYRLLTYGLPWFEGEDAQKIIADKWGIEFYPVAGCIVTQELQDSVHKENEIVHKQLEARYGKGWHEKLGLETNKEFKDQQKAIALIKKQPFIKHKNAELRKEDTQLIFHFTASGEPGIYEVHAYASVLHPDTYEYTRYYQLAVDKNNKTVTIISDLPVKEEDKNYL